MGVLPKKILVFDSGVGGLSILQELRQQLPGHDYIYACDNQAFPYGTKEPEALVHRVNQVLQALIRHTSPDIIVVACNTASTVALPRIRADFSNPVVGVVPAIKPAAALSTSKTIGLLGTPGTVSRHYTQQLIDDFAADCTVIRVGSHTLVELAETKLRGGHIDPQQLSPILAPFFAVPALDTIVLACTHFPLLLDELQVAAPRPINWVDCAAAIARRVASLLPPQIDKTSARDSGFHCLLTADYADSEQLLTQITLLGCKQMDSIQI